MGQTIIDNLFPNGENPIGKVIRFNKIPLKIVGTLTPKGYNSMGMDQDDMVLAPYTTVQKRVLAITYLQGIFCSALTEELTPQAIDEITQILRKNHKIKEGEEDDFEIRSQEEMSSMMSSTTDMMTILLACIAGISLLVGGIGIMNRGRAHQRHGRHYRGTAGRGCVDGREPGVQLAGLYPSLFGDTLLPGMYLHRHLLRLVPGPQSGQPRPHRSHSL